MKSVTSVRIVSLILCVITVLSVFAVIPVSAADSDYKIRTTDAVRLRNTPEIADDNYILTLSVNEELTLLADSANGWVNVKRADGTKGYCSIDYVNAVDDAWVSFTGVTNDDVNFRKSATTESTSMAFLSKGQEFTVLDNSNEEWVKVEIDDTQGYIYRDYTDLSMKIVKEKPTEPTEPAKPTNPQKPVETTAPAKPQETIATKPQATTIPPVVSKVPEIHTPNWYDDAFAVSTDPVEESGFKGDFIFAEEVVYMKTGETRTLSLLTLGSGFNNTATFSGSDDSALLIEKGGIVTACKAAEVKVIATFKGKSASCTVVISGEDYTPPTTATEPPSTTTEPPTTLATEPTTVPTLALSAASAKIEKDNYFVLKSPKANTTWSSSNKAVATVDQKGLVKGVSEGEAVITATANGISGTCKITVVKSTIGLTIEYKEVEITRGKTFFNSADSSSAISWTSSDEKVATVNNGFITAKSNGTAIVTASSAKGTKTCFVTVKEAEPVRFAYAYPNTAAKNEKITLVAITDTLRTAVQFKVDINGNVKTIDATTKKADGNTLVWSAQIEIAQAGLFNVTAYSKLGTMFSACNDSKTTVFVRESDDLLKETKETRRASDELIALVAAFEGYVGNVYFDTLAGGLPTLGYGKVVYTGDSFYNDMTKTEAYALLYDTVNNGGYSDSVNSYLKSYNANYNQQQFDALVSFVYNIGAYALRSDTEIPELIKNSVEKVTVKDSENAAFINADNVNFRSGAGTNFESLGLLSYGQAITLADKKLVNTNWYHVKTADGKEGYVYKDYVTLGVLKQNGEIYLSLIDKSEFSRVILEYHHAGGKCVYGLLYRRADELELFYYGDYKRDGDANKFGFAFTCYKDKSFTL